MQHAIVYTALSGAGKTNVINHVFKERGYKIVSSSYRANKIVEDLVRVLCQEEIDLQKKHLSYKFGVTYYDVNDIIYALESSQGDIFARRELIIAVAEKVIKENLGSDVFGNKAAQEVVNAYNIQTPVVYECFYPEYFYFRDRLKDLSDNRINLKHLNVISDMALYSGDRRRLFDNPEYVYENNREDSIEIARNKFSNWLDENKL